MHMTYTAVITNCYRIPQSACADADVINFLYLFLNVDRSFLRYTVEPLHKQGWMFNCSTTNATEICA